MKIQMETFNLNGIIPFTAQVERGIGFIYGLKTQRNSQNYDVTSIIKIPAGRYIEEKLYPFFQFKSGSSIVYPFEVNYPHKNSHDTFGKIYFIKKIVDQNTTLYYNVKNNKWVSDKYKASFFFTENNAQKTIENSNFNAANTISISYLILEYNQIIADGVEFPVTNYFSLTDIFDYSGITTKTITIEVYDKSSI